MGRGVVGFTLPCQNLSSPWNLHKSNDLFSVKFKPFSIDPHEVGAQSKSTHDVALQIFLMFKLPPHIFLNLFVLLISCAGMECIPCNGPCSRADQRCPVRPGSHPAHWQHLLCLSCRSTDFQQVRFVSH